MAYRVGIAILVLLSACLPISLHAGSTSASRPPQLNSAAVLVMDQVDGEVLIAKQIKAAMPIASITKLMTAMVMLDARLDMGKIISIEEADKDALRNSPSDLFIGARLTRREALLVALMASENRAAHALARTFPGGVDALVKAMNEKAKALALAETKFEDPTGLSKKNISSARDLIRLMAAACGYPEICAYSTTHEITLQSGQKQMHFVNTNALIGNPDWQIGLSKTGYIGESGRCLVMQTELAGRPLLIVLLNSSGENARLSDANRIKNWLQNR
jgi:serine-type D-Ala-D-Ala endopeptidase (penicillin-binding protein 7)